MATIISDLTYRLIADDKELTKSLKDAQKRAEALGKSFTDAGKKLTIGLTAPIVAAAGVAVKFASDLQESTNSVNVVFGESAKIITAWGENAATQAGLSRAEFNSTATQIGVLLQQTGKSFDDVAEDTITLTQRAADLASIYNTDVKDATLALGAALRGESEPARRFGVLLSESAVQAKALELGLGGVKGELTEAEKVQTRYAIILEQTQAVAGDFANTSGDTANSLRVLQAEVQNLAAEFGQELLPIVKDVLTFARDLVAGFGDLTQEQRQTVIAVAAVAAAIGPLLLAIGKTITAVSALKGALTALQVAGGGPVALAIAGVTALGIGLAVIVNNAKRVQEARLEETFGELAREIGVTNIEALNFSRIGRQLEDDWQLSKIDGQLLNISAYVGDIARQAGLTNEQALNGLLLNQDLSSEFRSQLQTLLTQEQLSNSLKAEFEEIRTSRATVVRTETTIAGSLEAQLESQRQLARVVEERYLSAREKVLAILGSEITEYDRIQAQIDELQTTPWATGQLEDDRLAAIEVLRARQQEIIDEETKEREEAALAESALLEAQFLERVRRDQELRDQQLATIAAEQENERLLEEEKKAAHLAELARIAKERAELADKFSQISSSIGDVGKLSNAIYAREIQNIEQSGLSEIQKQEEIAKIKKRQAIFDKSVAIAQIAINTAAGIVKALPNPFLVTFAAITGALQLATAIATPIPEFATGGSFVVPPGFQNDSFPLAMAQSGERVTVETPAQASLNDSQNHGITLQVGTLIANEAGLRELDLVLRQYGRVNDIALGEANG